MSKADELLLERELRGLKLLTAIRGAAVIVVVGSHWLVAASDFERYGVTAIGVIWGLAIVWFWSLLRRRRGLALVGLGGAALDVAVLALMPLIWYLSVGGSSVPPAYMLKTGLTVFSFTLVALTRALAPCPRPIAASWS